MTRINRAGWLWLVFALAATGIAPVQAQAATETVLHNFASPPRGANARAGVIRDAAGNLFGTTYAGGAANAGVVFKVNTSGQQAVLYSFTGGTDGKNPWGGVVRDSSGNFYGTTYYGGAGGAGVVYKVDTTGHETVLYSFSGGLDGGYPEGGVIIDSAGNLYGTTEYGGAPYRGVVFKVDTAGNETVLYTFSGETDGNQPLSGLFRDSSGNLYGTTYSGGASGAGVVFKVDTLGNETVLYSFTGGDDGGSPWAGVILDASGNIYGTTAFGGTDNAGVVYKLDTTGHETVLHSFTFGADGGEPLSGVVRDSAGDLFGTTFSGGLGGAGVVYKLNTSGHETKLYSFTGGADGKFPSWAGVIRDSSGNFYGTTANGGTANAGVVFKLDTSGNETVVYSFPGTADGGDPYGGVVRDSAGNFYGTTQSGGASGSGMVYKLDTSGHETVLYTFTGGADGSQPYAGVVLDSAGNLYGTTYMGGTGFSGVIYKVDTTGQQTVLYNFAYGTGADPEAGVILDSAGNLYGTTAYGGTAGYGVVYKLDTTNTYTVLYNFTGGSDGSYPYAGVLRDSAGNLYGTTNSGGTSGSGVVYKLDAANNFSVLYTFTGGTDGESPQSGVIRDPAGNLYGTTYYGGTGFSGVIYKVDTTGHETVLYNFTYTDGGEPIAGVIFDSAGNLYGTTYYGGAANAGVVYELDTARNYTLLYSFTGGADGGNPRAGVLRDSAGHLFGTAASGGARSTGVVFRITP
jgi:uncharacterized repeat protein (TIGR03803 family)